MPLEEGEGISETQIAFYNVAGHDHDGENSTKIDFSEYDILDILNLDRLRDIIVGTVNNSSISPNMLQVGSSEDTIVIDGAAPSAVTNMTASSTASTTSDGNIFIDVSWTSGTNSSISKYVIELHKSETGINGTYVITRSHETTALSHRFERIDNNTGDGGNVYYKVVVYAISSVGVRSSAVTSAGISPAVNSTPPANTAFNDDYAAFDEGVKTAFKGMFVYLDDNTEFDVKELRGQYEYQVSINKTSFDTSANLKASGKSKSTYFLVNNLDVRASAGGAKIDYYLRVRSINSSGTTSSWVYYKNTADGGANGVGTTTASAASAINVLEINAGVDVQANTITANEIFAGTITATEIGAGEITGENLNSITINASRYIQSPDFVSGSDGWKIEGSGNAEFSEVTVRGIVYANTGKIGGDSGWVIASNIIQSGTGASAVHINSGGGSTPYLRMGAKAAYNDSNTGVWLDPVNGLVLGASQRTRLKIDGTGNIGAWVIGADSLAIGGGDTGIELKAGAAGSRWVTVGDGKGVIRSHSDGSAVIGIDGSGAKDPQYNTAGDIVMELTASDVARFSVGTKMTFDGTNLTIDGGGTFSGALSGAGGDFTGSLDVGGADATSFHVNTSGDMWLGAAALADAPFRVSSTGQLDIGDDDATSWHVDKDGNMWWGSGANYAAASIKISNLGSVTFTSGSFSGAITGGTIDIGDDFSVTNAGVVTCADITITGGSQVIGSNYNVSDAGVLTATDVDVTGEINATSGSFTGAITAGSLTITGGSMTLGSGVSTFKINTDGTLTSGLAAGGTAAPFYVAPSGLVSIGPNTETQVRFRPDTSDFEIFDGTAMEFASATTGGTVHGYVQGDSQTVDFGYGSHTFKGVVMGADENYIGVFQTWGTAVDPAYGVVLSATKGTGQYDERSILLHADEIINLNAGDGIYISDQSAPTPTTANRLYAVSGALYWNGTNVTATGSGTVTSVATTGAITGGTITTTGTIAHSTANGYKHIPSNGSANQVLVYGGSAGTAAWGAVTGDMDSWYLKVNGESPGVEVTNGEALNIAAGSNVTVSRVSQSVTIAATNTTYSVGDGGLTQNNFTNADHSKLDGITDGATANIGDITAVNTATNSGLAGGGAGPGSLGLTLSVSNLPAESSPVVGDYLAMYDTSGGQSQKVLVSDIVALAPQGDITSVTGTSGLTGSGLDGDVVLSHANTSDQESINGSGNEFIQDITLDAYGHISSMAKATSTGGTTYSALSNGGLGLSGTEFYILWTNTGTGFGGSYSTNLLYEAAYGVTYKTSISTVVETGLGGGLTMGSSASVGSYTTYINNSLKYITSREATKDHITTVSGADALVRIESIRPVNFYFNDKVEPENEMARLQKQRGFVAEELAAVDHNYASWGWLDDDGNLMGEPEEVGKDLGDAVPIAYQLHSILADAVGAIQALSTKLEAAEARLAALEA